MTGSSSATSQSRADAGQHADGGAEEARRRGRAAAWWARSAGEAVQQGEQGVHGFSPRSQEEAFERAGRPRISVRTLAKTRKMARPSTKPISGVDQQRLRAHAARRAGEDDSEMAIDEAAAQADAGDQESSLALLVGWRLRGAS
ncbi:hypothetical protein [Bosea thiooxidans]